MAREKTQTHSNGRSVEKSRPHTDNIACVQERGQVEIQVLDVKDLKNKVTKYTVGLPAPTVL
jgi:hypothetical protein